MRKTALRMILIVLIAGMFGSVFNAGLDCVYAPKPPTITNVSPASSLADDLLFDFSETKFYFVDPLESWFVFKFKVTNIGTKNLLLGSCCSCNIGDEVVGLPLLAPQGETPLEPGESMWIKIVPAGGEDCGYDPNVLQTVTRTFHIEIQDNNANYDPWEANQVTMEKEIQIEVVSRETLEGDVLIQGMVVDGQGSPIPYAQIDIGGYGANLPMACDDGGYFSYSVAQTSVYFLTAHEEGYRPTTIEINGSDVQDFYSITLEQETSPLSVNSSLMNTIEGNIGFWRCAATADESKLLLVNGMENWENESLKNQSKLYLLGTSTGEVLWTHDMGWESWSADISDDGKYVVFGTKLEGFQTGPEGFVNYIRLIDGENGTTIWQKEITTENFPATTHGEFYTRGVKFSHSGEYIFVPTHCEYGYLLNSADGSLLWCKWVGANIREVIFTQDDQYVYVPSGAGWLYKLRVNDASEVWKQWIGTWAYVGGFDLSSDEQHIAVGTKTGYLTVINTTDGSIRFSMDIHNGHAHCRFSPDGTKLVVGGEGLMMLDLDGNLLWRYYPGGQIDIRFSGDGRFITTEAGEVFDAHGALTHDITPSEPPPGCYHQVGWLNSEGTRFICALRDTPASGSDIIEVYRIETALTSDITAPAISILSPENKTYATNSIPLTFTVNEATSWIGYSLNSQENVTLAGNTTLADLHEGTYSLVIYANDTVGNMGSSSVVCFTINQTQTFHVVLDSIDYMVTMRSNSTITDFVFNQTLTQVSFNVNGIHGAVGFCNVTIPKSLLTGDPWMITIEGESPIDFIPSDNATHSFLYFTYMYTSTLHVIIQGTWVVPEFQSLISLPLFMIATLLAVIIYRRKHSV